MNSSFEEGRSENLREGQIFEGRFQILSVIGKGGAGTVYKAKHTHMDKIVAIKTLISSVGWDDNETFLRFEKESRAASALGHPNIISILDFGRSVDGHAYLVMEYLGSNSLDDVLKQQRRLDTERFYRIFSQICDGLQHAHKKGIIHRDIKPSNIMLMDTDEATDVVKIVDFGLAKLTSRDEEVHLTKTGAIMGTPLYMSPEQCRGLELDHRSDIYSLGCVMYKSLTGRLPVIGATPLDTLYKHTTENPPSFGFAAPELTLPSQLEQAILRSLSKNPDHRQQSMAELRNEIQGAILTPVIGGKRAETAPTANIANADPSQSRTVKAITPAIVEAKKTVRSLAVRADDVAPPKAKLPATALAVGLVLLVIAGCGAYFMRTLDNSNPKPLPSTNNEKQLVASVVASKPEPPASPADHIEETARTPDSQPSKKDRSFSGTDTKVASASLAPTVSRRKTETNDRAGRDAGLAIQLKREAKQRYYRDAQTFFQHQEWQRAKDCWQTGRDQIGTTDEEKFVVSAHIMRCDFQLGSIKNVLGELDPMLKLIKDKEPRTKVIVFVKKRGREARYIWRSFAQMSWLAARKTQGEKKDDYIGWTKFFFLLADQTWTDAQKKVDPDYAEFRKQFTDAMAPGKKPKVKKALTKSQQPATLPVAKPEAAQRRGGHPHSEKHGRMIIRTY